MQPALAQQKRDALNKKLADAGKKATDEMTIARLDEQETKSIDKSA